MIFFSSHILTCKTQCWLINWIEPIIDQETFDNVQRIRGNVKRYPDGWGEYHPLTGLMYCADCGSKMYVHRTSNYKNIPYYTCSAYTKVPCGTLCLSAHRIKAENPLGKGIPLCLQDQDCLGPFAAEAQGVDHQDVIPGGFVPLRGIGLVHCGPRTPPEETH